MSVDFSGSTGEDVEREQTWVVLSRAEHPEL